MRLLFAILVTLAACTDGREDVAVVTAPVCVEHSPTLWGIDVSKWQGNIDWAKVKAAGVKYAFIRVSDGVSTIDEKFPQNWAGAAAAGIPRGVYQFFRPNRDALEQADIVLDHLAIHGMGELPPVIDVEATGEQPPAVVAAKVGEWIDAIESALGQRPIIYSGSYFWDDNVGSTAFSGYPFWIAHYTDAACPRLPAAWSDWTFWQYSSTGSVSGITGNVDMNRYVGDEDDLLALAAPEVVPEPDPEPAPEVVEPEPTAEIIEPEPSVEIVEPVPEVTPEVTTEDTAPLDTASPIDTGPDDTRQATTPGTPSRTVAQREITPAAGCAGARSADISWLLLGLVSAILSSALPSARRRAAGASRAVASSGARSRSRSN